MNVIATDLRNTRPAAKEISFNPVLPFTARNVQDAILQIATLQKPITVTSVNFGMSPYTPALLDSLLEVDTSGGPVTINLTTGASRAGLDLEIKDITGQAGNGTNKISLVPSGAETVDGLAPYLIDSPFSSVKLGPKTSGGYFVHA